METLFDLPIKEEKKLTRSFKELPLSTRMRPVSLQDYIGQGHLLSEGKLLYRAILSRRISSMIFYGPPGTGKTSLARLIAKESRATFIEQSGVSATAASLREIFQQAERASRHGEKTILFLDEIHRLHKGQQDLLLPVLEEAPLILIGATTENPFFSLIPPLISRAQIFPLHPLTIEELISLQKRALQDREKGLGELPLVLEPEAAQHFACSADGDARKCLDALELAATTTPYNQEGKITIGLVEAEQSIQKKAIAYEATGDQHYDIISAFIKSIRGSDPDAAIYWLATMLYAGEDPLFIARRLLILASEDIGLADPQALPLAVAVSEAVATIGLPEGRIPLAHATIYLAKAPKSNSAYRAINAALADVENTRSLAVPAHLRDSHYDGAARLGSGKGYLYPHDFPGGKVTQEYLSEPRHFYSPTARDL